MSKCYALMLRFLRDESGATAVEYAVLGGLIGTGLIAGVKLVVGGTNSTWSDINNTVNSTLHASS